MYWYFHHGELYQRLNRFAEANADFESAILLVQTNTFPMSPCPVTIKQNVPAFFKKYLHIDSDIKLIKHNFKEGQASLEKGEFFEAFRSFAIASWINLLDLKKQKIQDNLAAFQRDQRAFAEDLFEAGKEWLAKSNYDLALGCFNLAVKRVSNDPRVYIERGVAYQQLKQNGNAIADFKKALE